MADSPLSPDLQPLWDDLQIKNQASSDAIAAKAVTATALTAAQTADAAAASAEDAAHQALQTAIAAFIMQFQRDYPA